MVRLVYQKYFLAGLQVFNNSGISVCENEAGKVSSIGEDTAGARCDSEMIADNATAEVMCVKCGKPLARISSDNKQLHLTILYTHYRPDRCSNTFCVCFCCDCHTLGVDWFVY